MSTSATLSTPAESLAPCPKFRILVLGNPESTKQELFSKIFGVDLKKQLVAEGFQATHDIDRVLDLEGKNERLAIYTSLNFGSDDESIYTRVCDFIQERSSESLPLQERIHCIWYCVASEEDRPISQHETRFFGGEIGSIAKTVPVLLVFTKYDDFVSEVQLEWSHTQGLSKVAVSHILRDLAAKRFEKSIAKRWDAVLLDDKGRSRGRHVSRVCVASGTDPDGDESSFEDLANTTLQSLREWKEWHVKLAFAAAQRNSASISTRFCADTASEYFTVQTGHARKIDGIDIRDIMPNFWAKAIKIFNMRDNNAVLEDPKLLSRVLGATFDVDKRLLLDEILEHSSTKPTIILGLSPHERAVLLAQALGGVVMFLDKLADAQWPHRETFFYTLTRGTIESELLAMSAGHENRELLETIEGSPVFTSCLHKQAVADLMVKAVEVADRIASPHGRSGSRTFMVEDDSELQEISLSFVNDKGPDDIVLPCGLTILPLN